MAKYLSVRRGLNAVWQHWRGRRDAQALAENCFAGQDLTTRLAAAAECLKAPYEEYIASVSTREMAVSWNTACFLHALADLRKPRRVVDLGSGFSSFVLRTYAASADHPCEITSVDDDAGWLTRTVDYLQQKGLSTDRLLTWKDFVKQLPADGFDLIFHDIGSMQMRAEVLPQVLNMVSTTGIVVLDDMHKPSYRREAHLQARQHGWTVLSAHRATLDGLGRFSEVALPRCA